MSDDIKFTTDGLKLEGSIATEMAVMLATTGTVGTVIAAAVFLLEVVQFLSGGDDNSEALRRLEEKINELRDRLADLEQRVDQIALAQAAEANRNTLRDLNGLLGQIRGSAIALKAPNLDDETVIRIANDISIVIDRFLESDFDIWRWSDVVVQIDPATGNPLGEPFIKRLQFKNLPTLPVYLMGIMIWLAAREIVVGRNQRDRLDDDAARIERHRAALSVRRDFDKYRGDELGRPQSIIEHIKWNIRGIVHASDTRPVNQVCRFFYDVQNWMTGERRSGDPFDLQMPSDFVLCTVDPDTLGTPSIELEFETAAGETMLLELNTILGRVANTGSVRQQFIGIFATVDEVHAPGTFYTISETGEVAWTRNFEASLHGGSDRFRGPLPVGTGWNGYREVFSGGGRVVYAVREDGVLLWFSHTGWNDGTPVWDGPKEVGSGWTDTEFTFAGGERVLYSVRRNGDLSWHRHDGAGSGSPIWAQQRTVGNGWSGFKRVFSEGKGIIYTLTHDGHLVRHQHNGYLTGEPNWEWKETIARRWTGYREILAPGAGVFYWFTPDGRILWYRRSMRKVQAGDGWSFPMVWEGPVEIKRDLPAFKLVFQQMNPPASVQL